MRMGGSGGADSLFSGRFLQVGSGTTTKTLLAAGKKIAMTSGVALRL
jgi:hypothetical protein